MQQVPDFVAWAVVQLSSKASEVQHASVLVCSVHQSGWDLGTGLPWGQCAD